MTIPDMEPFKLEDAQVIERSPMAAPYVPFEEHGPACTLKIKGKPVACIGYDRIPEQIGCASAWMILSKDARKYPRVFWAIRTILESSCEVIKRMMILVPNDWPEAQRFAAWLGFYPAKGPVDVEGRAHMFYVKEGLPWTH